MNYCWAVVQIMERRTAIRFQIQLACNVIRTRGFNPNSSTSETVNISSKAAMVSGLDEVSVGDHIEYLVYLPVPPGASGVHVHCLGKVVRTGEFGTAVTIERYTFERVV